MTAKRLLLGSTILTSLALAAPASALADLIINNGVPATLSYPSTQNEVAVGLNTLGNELSIIQGAQLTSYQSFVSKGGSGGGGPAPNPCDIDPTLPLCNVVPTTPQQVPTGMTPQGDASVNAVIVSGNGSAWNTGASPGGGTLYLGYLGSRANLLVVEGGEVSAAQNIVLGYDAGSTENGAVVSGASSGGERASSLVFTDLIVGDSGSKNIMSVVGGGVAGANTGSQNVIIGNEATSTENQLTVHGKSEFSASRLTARNIEVGNHGSVNALAITNGGMVTTSAFALGRNTGLGSNQLVISGAGSALTIQGNSDTGTPRGAFYVGQRSSNNSAIVLEGGSLLTGAAWIGGETDWGGVTSGNGLTVSGAGSSWQLGGELRIGESAVPTPSPIQPDPDAPAAPEGSDGSDNNFLNVEAGAHVTQLSSDTQIGVKTWDTGNRLTVTGAGSEFSTLGNIYVGTSDGTSNNASLLEIISGGKVSAKPPMHATSMGQASMAGGVIVARGSTLSVGSGGTLEASYLSLDAGSTLKVAVGDGANASTISIDGDAALDGALQYQITAAQLQAKSYSVLHAGVVSGTFDTTTATGFTAVKTSVRYTDTDVWIDLTSAIAELPDLNKNQTEVAKALDKCINAVPPCPVAYKISADFETTVLSEIDGEVGATITTEINDAVSDTLSTIDTYNLPPHVIAAIENQSTTTGASNQTVLNSNPVSNQPNAQGVVATADAPPAPSGWSMWGTALGGTAQVSGDDHTGSHDTTGNNAGLITGWDYTFSEDRRMGLFIAGGGSHVELDDNLGSGDNLFGQIGVRGSEEFGNTFLTYSGLYAFNSLSTSRTVNLPGDREKLEADFTASSLGGRIRAGHAFIVAPGFGLTPYGALQGQATFMPSYHETASSGGNDAALAFESDTVSGLRGELGLSADGVAGPTLLHGSIAWAHDWTDAPKANASFASSPGSGFTVYGAEVPADIALVEARMDYALNTATTFSAQFNGEFAEGYETYTGALTLAYQW